MKKAHTFSNRLVFRSLVLGAFLALGGCDRPPDENSEIEAAKTAESEPAQTENEQVKNRGDGKDQWWDELPRAPWQALKRIDQSQDWFEVYEVQDGVLAIYEPGQFEEVISYLLMGSEKALLFDTGLGIGDMRRLVDELTPLDVTVINSHSHYDHVGGNHAFDRVLGADTEYTLRRSQGLAHEEVAEFVGPGWIWKETPEGFAGETYETKAWTIDSKLEDGQKIELGGRTLEVLLTPGHAPDALCLLDRQNGLLLTGDTFYPAPLYTHLEGSDFDAYVETARRLADLSGELRWVLPAHNETPIEAEVLERLREAFDGIASGRDPDVITDGNWEFRFEGFSIVTRPRDGNS